MAADEKWYFTKEQLASTPSRRGGIDADKELSYRQQAANFIQDMGQRLVVTQLCINTAIVYMHRFYVFHSLAQFHRNAIAAASLFLAAKVEEQPRKLEHVIKVAHMCLHKDQNTPDPKSDHYLEQAQDLVFNENVLLQTLGFDVAIDHPHTHVVKCCQLVKASKDLAQTSYFMASNSLHLTTMCLQYKPTVVACFCIHLACKWSNWEIPQSNEGKHWFWYVDKTVTSELLQHLTVEFLHIFDRCPSRLKKKIMSMSEKQSPTMHHPSLPNSPFDVEPRKVNSPASDGGPTFQSARPFPQDKDDLKAGTSRPLDPLQYREKKDRERMEREKLAGTIPGAHPHEQKHHHHHKPPQNPLLPSKHPQQPSKPIHHNHHHRPDPKLVGQPQRHSQSRQRPPGVHPHQVLQNQGLQAIQNPQTVQGQIPYQKDAQALHTGDVQQIQDPQDKGHHRRYDPRHKPPEHRTGDPKAYKYGEQMRQDRQRKPDSLEQRSEEVRKLIEKPLPPPKPRELTKEDYMATMMKQSHHPPKYPEKPVHNSTRVPVPEFGKPVLPPKPLPAPQGLPKEKNGLEERRMKEELPQKHKSLFSPEKTIRDPPRVKPPRQKTPPMVQVKAIKQERILEGNVDLGIFPRSPQGLKAPKVEPEDVHSRRPEEPSFDLMKMFGKLPEPLPPLGSLRDVPTNGRGIPDIKPDQKPDSKPFDDIFDPKPTILTNGLDAPPSELDQLLLDRLEPSHKTEYLSPLKSAQGISALLQEPLAPMPSLLSQSTDSGHGSQSLSQPFSQPLPQPLPPPVLDHTPQLVPKLEHPSTVDISALSSEMPALVLPPPLPELITPEPKKSDHHKSEKKKKKEKHKHKDKDKSKEKHKHKHKEKDRDRKEREKSSLNESSTEPIKITIPKDKIGLANDGQERKSPSGKLTLKINKERLKPDAVQIQTVQTVQTIQSAQKDSLKIKISRTSGGIELPESRKREREKEGEMGPASKKSNSGSGQMRTGERQNGRHYGTTGNKEKHSREHKSSSKLSQSQQSHTT